MILKRETTMASRSRVKRASGEMVLSKIVAGVDVPYPPEARTVAERSLEGLITFLTSYYRNLPTWDSSACPWRISSSPSASSRLTTTIIVRIPAAVVAASRFKM
uniref:PIR2-like helical domain-containing protein n=1 Tax=Oryza meridionalis TaxID=40149 RepID=A0A0E0E089_9ORYZ